MTGRHSTVTAPRPGSVTLRAEDATEDDGMMEIRMPIASTGDVRNEGDDPLTSSELRGMAEQVSSLTTGVFPEHGMSNAVDSGQYTQFEKLGYWADGTIQEGAAADGEDLLMATARMPDPETLPSATGDYRESLAILKEQAKRGVPISASIGWADDDGMPGGVDLLEASIVGIGADPRTSTEAGTELLARAAVEAGADPDDLVSVVRDAVQSDGRREVVDVNGTEIDITPPEAVVNAVEAALDAKEEYADELGDCGTGDGEETARKDGEVAARKVSNNDLSAEYIAKEVAAYLTSHAEDVEGYDEPPTEWGRMQWLGMESEDDDPRCGPVQYALWAGTATGTGLEWATSIANQYAEANDEDLPYPERSNTDTQSMSDDNDPPDTEGGTDTDSEQAADDGEPETRGMEERMEEMREMLRENTEKTREMYERMMEDGDGEGDGDDEEEDEDEEDDGEQSADADDADERSADADNDAEDLHERIAELEDELESVRDGDVDVETPEAPDTDGEQSADDADAEDTEQRDNDGDTLRDEWLSN